MPIPRVSISHHYIICTSQWINYDRSTILETCRPIEGAKYVHSELTILLSQLLPCGSCYAIGLKRCLIIEGSDIELAWEQAYPVLEGGMDRGLIGS